jgi:dephospho-CoA kinase
MLVVGLTGGIGAGKSTLAALLAEEGAHVIDADALGREALQPGRPAWHSVVDQFGDEILAAGSMTIDRKRLAAVVFADAGKLAALNAIVHPVIFKGIADRLEERRGTDAIVVLDAALIVEAGLDTVLDLIVVVDSSTKKRRDRLVTERGMTEDEIAARMVSQASQEKLLERADIVVRNDGSLEELAKDARRVWRELIARQ